MKLLIIITGHRHYDEYKYNGLFMQKCTDLTKLSEIFVHCNCPTMDIENQCSYFPQKTTIHITDKNAGHTLGGIEAVCDTIDQLQLLESDYDYVIHIHPDVFIIHEKQLLQILYEELNTPTSFIVNRSVPNDDRWFSFDFFIFKPSLLKKTNIFKDWQTWCEWPEYFLHDRVIQYQLPYKLIKRYEDDYWYPRRMDMLGIWHEHDMNSIISYYNTNYESQ